MIEPLRIERKESLHLVGLRAPFVSALVEGSEPGCVIGPLWGALIPRLGEIGNVEPGVTYGYACFPDGAVEVPAGHLLYLAGARADPADPVPAGMVAVDTAPGLYAVFEHRGPITSFLGTIHAIYREWLPASPYQGNGRGDLEVYGEAFGDGGEGSRFEVWIGVQPQDA